MAIYKITYSDKYRRATLHHHGCNFRCRGCTYRLKDTPAPRNFPSVVQIQNCLRELDIEAVHFMGGEPTTNPQLPELLAFCKRELGLKTRLGHTNGSGLVLDDLDGSNVSFKAFDDDLHREYTGHPAAVLFENFRKSYEAGLEMKASTVYNPDFAGESQLEKIVEFLSTIDRKIPFHILGYIPVPGAPWRRPTEEAMQKAVSLARARLENVTFSHFTSEQAKDLRQRDDRFEVRQVL